MTGMDWPCDDYRAPLTCWTVPSGNKVLICAGCREAFPNGAEVQNLYADALAYRDVLLSEQGAAIARVEAYRGVLSRSNQEYMRLHARSPKIAIATVIDRIDAALHSDQSEELLKPTIRKSVGTSTVADYGPSEASCECPPCPGRGNDGHRMTHCAECCFGSGVVADPDCPIHGEPSTDA